MTSSIIIGQEGEQSWETVDAILERGDYDPELVARFHRSGTASGPRKHPHPRSDGLMEHSAHAAAGFALLLSKIEELEAKIEDLESAVDHEST